MKHLLFLGLLIIATTCKAQMPHFSREKPHKPTPTPKSQKAILPHKELWIRKQVN